MSDSELSGHHAKPFQGVRRNSDNWKFNRRKVSSEEHIVVLEASDGPSENSSPSSSAFSGWEQNSPTQSMLLF